MRPKHALRAGAARMVAGLTLFGLSACGPSTHTFTGTQRAIGVDARVEVHEIEGGNREVRLDLQHLPPPARMGSGMTVYAMWLVPNGRQPTLASFIQYDERARQGVARATTPAERFEVRVTAERNRQVAAPSELVIAQRAVH